MTSLDVRDVLNLPQDGSAPRPSKKSRPSGPRTNLKGLAREVQSLGGDNPIAIVPETSVFKKRRQSSRKPAARWELRQFKNSARNDPSLVLRHWCRKKEGVGAGAQQQQQQQQGDGSNQDESMADTGQPSPAEDQIEDSAFAKFNVKVDVPQYNEDQYNAQLRADGWTKDETDYLLELVRDFDLRWPLIWDRYEYKPPRPDGEASTDGAAVVPASQTRSMEDLKARYYFVAAKMMAAQKPAHYMTSNEHELYEIMLKFDPVQEAQRKRFAANCLTRSREEAREEESLLLEVKRILARQERFNEERRELYNRLDYPPTSDSHDISSFKTSQGLSNLIQNIVTADKSKKRKSLMATEASGPASAGPNGQPAPAAAENRQDSIAVTPVGNTRDSISAVEKPTPVEAPSKGSKKGAAQPERRRLTEHEEQVYGVTYHDRLSSGPAFRNEKVNKLFSHKSMQQQQRITNVLNELDIPARLTMPTASVTAQFEQLVHSVTQLVDLRKQIDKLDGEIKIEQARKAEREKSQGAAAAASAAATAVPKAAAAAATENGDKAAAAALRDAESGAPAPAKDDKGPPAAEAARGDKAPDPQPPTTNGDTKTTNGHGPAVRDEDAADKDKEKDKDKATRPGSRGSRPGSRHKRSASVLSAGSDKGKRQKR